jgi:uncharacterized protein (TIGR02246 family)
MNQTATSTPATEAKSKIEAVLAALQESWNHHDMAAFANQFAANADFVNVLGLRLQGRHAIEAQHVAIHKTFFRNSQLETLDQTIRFLTPQVALAHVAWQMTGHKTPAIKNWQLPAERKGVFTAVLTSEGDAWQITALHNTDSVPVPGLGKASE